MAAFASPVNDSAPSYSSRFWQLMAQTISKGKLLANLLYQSWRADAPPPEISENELATITPLLTGSGAGALAWVRIRDTHLRDSASGVELQQAYRLHAVHASVFEEDLKEVIALLRSAHVETLLIKGWAVASLYPDSGLRPYGDIDLCVLPAQYDTALAVCKSPEGRKYLVDLHRELDETEGANIDELFSRSQVVKLGNVDVRVPCLEDHVRLLALHFLRHGAWRPLWLCDIGAAVESRSADFDWDLCLAGNRRRADWVACCIGLADRLLGAEIDDTPVSRRAENLPRWLITQVLKQWETPFASAQAPLKHQAPMSKYLHSPRGLLADLGRRWPNPIEATVNVGGPFNELPRWPFQIGDVISRTTKFFARLPKALKEDKPVT